MYECQPIKALYGAHEKCIWNGKRDLHQQVLDGSDHSYASLFQTIYIILGDFLDTLTQGTLHMYPVYNCCGTPCNFISDGKMTNQAPSFIAYWN